MSLSWTVHIVILGHEVILRCSVQNGDYMNDTVCFHRNDNNTWCLYQKRDLCTPVNQTMFHEVRCGKGTTDNWSKVKEYLLTIKKVSRGDKSKWWCDICPFGEGSNSFFLQVLGEFVRKEMFYSKLQKQISNLLNWNGSSYTWKIIFFWKCVYCIVLSY